MKRMKKVFAFLLTMVMLVAMGVTAFAAEESYTITITNAVEGETYTAYKIFDADYANDNSSAVSYTATAEMYTIIKDLSGTAGLSFTKIDGKDVYVVTKGESFDAANFAASLDGVKDKLTVAGNKTAAKADDGTVSASITVNAKGYYFVDTTLGSLCSLSTAKNVNITEKNEMPTIDKEETDVANKTPDKTSVNAQIGDTIYYQLTVTDKKGTDKAITVHDTMTEGLTLNENSFKIMKDGKDVDSANYTINTINTSSLTDGCTFEIVLAEKYVKTLSENDKVIITYNAVLNEKAKVESAEKNTVKLTYSNQTSTETSVEVKTYKFAVLKYDGADEQKANLAGAEFKLQKTTKDEEENVTSATDVTLVKVSDTEYRVANAGETTTTATFATVASGNTTVYGLDVDATYQIVEVKAPTGYNKLTTPVQIELNTSNNFVAEVENNQGAELPSTGGIGTTLFYVIGAICVLGAGVLLVTRRRMASK